MKEKNGNLLIIIIFIAGVLIYGSLKKSKSFEEEIETLNINSVVRKKFINYNNHGIPYIVYDNDSIIVYQSWEDQIAVGDSIIKPEGSTKVIVKSINKYIEFDYNNPSQLPLPMDK
jgi:uncharacterized membrane protein